MLLVGGGGEERFGETSGCRGVSTLFKDGERMSVGCEDTEFQCNWFAKDLQ